MRRLPLIGVTWGKAVVGTDWHVELFLPVAIHVPEEEILHAVRALFPAFVSGRDVLTLRVGERLCVGSRACGNEKQPQRHRDTEESERSRRARSSATGPRSGPRCEKRGGNTSSIVDRLVLPPRLFASLPAGFAGRRSRFGLCAPVPLWFRGAPLHRS